MAESRGNFAPRAPTISISNRKMNAPSTYPPQQRHIPQMQPKRLRDYDLTAFHQSHPPTSPWRSELQYLLTIHLRSYFLALLFLLECFLVIFLIPGVGDQWLGETRFAREYALPYDHLRYLYIAFLSLLLILDLGVDLYYKGLRLCSKGYVVDIMSYRPARLLSSFTSYKRWRFYQQIDLQLSSQERLASWLVWASHGWKRFMIARVPLTMVIGLSARSAIVTSRTSVPLLRYTAMVYFVIRLCMFLGDALTKLVALIMYWVHMRPELNKRRNEKQRPGGLEFDGTLTGYWRGAVQRHTDVIMANSYRKGLPIPPRDYLRYPRRLSLMSDVSYTNPSGIVLREYV